MISASLKPTEGLKVGAAGVGVLVGREAGDKVTVTTGVGASVHTAGTELPCPVFQWQQGMCGPSAQAASRTILRHCHMALS